jgi:uncharacterized protein (DUF2062 family)
MPRQRLRRLLPDREQILANRFVRWLGPRLHHPRLWHWSRRGVALGVALGVFFGLLIPVAQIPVSAAAAIALRANLPAAAVSTLVTNPVTFAPIYYAAYRVGALITGDTVIPAREVLEGRELPEDAGLPERIRALGTPLLAGLAVMAALCGLLAYLLISLTWRLWVWRRRRRGPGPR